MRTTYWTPERDAEMERRYPMEGATAIAAEWGVTKNMIVGRANRLGLTGTRWVRAGSTNRSSVVPRKPDPNPKGSCQWPHGDPRKQDFHFCGARAAAGRPYCAEHVRMAYYRPGDVSATGE